jgi:CO dehydrogenase/acetyl-CoA synthase epsilon subunit
MEQERIAQLYVTASKMPPVTAVDIEDADRMVSEATEPLIVVLPTLAIGREHRERVRKLASTALEKGVILRYDEASFLETTSQRVENMERQMLNGRKRN